MDQLPAQVTPTASDPFVYTSRPSRLVLIIAFLVIIILSFLAGYFFSKFNNSKNQPAAVPITPNSSIPTIPPDSIVKLPIETTSSSVKSLYIVYLLNGVVDSVTPATKESKSGYEIQILSPTGPVIKQRFFASDQTANIVSLDKKGKETKYQLSALKRGDPIQLNYQLDVKKDSETQITKITILK